MSDSVSIIRGPGTSTAFTNEPTTKLTANTVYQLNTDAKRLLDPAVAPTVEVDADGAGAGGYVVADPTTYTVNYLFGIITFLADQGASALVRVSGSYLPALDLSGVTSWSYTCSRTVLDTTEVQHADRARKLGLKDLSGSLSLHSLPSYDHDPGAGELILEDAIENGTRLLFEREVASKRFRAWVLLESAEDAAGIDDLFSSTFNMTGAAQASGGAGYSWEP